MELFLYLAAILLFPLIPAYILYKTLPAKTNVKGPFRGLTVNLSGAFSGYFLLVLITLGFSVMAFNSSKQKSIDSLQRTNDSLNTELNKASQSVSTWTMSGRIKASTPRETRVFYDNNTTTISPAGDFSSIIHIQNRNGKEATPLWVCMFNPVDGFGVIRLNPEISTDIETFDIKIDQEKKDIRIGKPISLALKNK